MRGTPPVKAACLACRASKTRCDGLNPCKPCLVKNRPCSFQPSRRGGPRRRTRNVLPEPSPQPPTVVDLAHPTPSLTEDSGTCSLVDDAGIWNTLALLSPYKRAQDAGRGSQDRFDALHAGATCEIQGPLLRVYTSEADILNAYYIFIHPFLPLLPPPVAPLRPDIPQVYQPSPGEAGAVDQSCLSYLPMSCLSLALSAILALIPPPQDGNPTDPCCAWLRRSYSNLFAQSALDSAEHAIVEPHESLLAPGPSDYDRRFHPDLPANLHPILTFMVLGVYDCCQNGHIQRMRMRVNQAITTAMDNSLHRLAESASEAQRRAWWIAIILGYQSSTVNSSSPIITTKDPRITTPYPAFEMGTNGLEPWSLILKAQDAHDSVDAIVRMINTQGLQSATASDLPDRITRLDRHILSLASDCDSSFPPTQSNSTEGCAARSFGLIASTLVHGARIKLHRFRAFSDVPIFLEKHCDLSSFRMDSIPAQGFTSTTAIEIEAFFPFSRDESSMICLKSALAISRAFKDIPCPRPPLSVYPILQDSALSPLGSDREGYSGSLPYFKCAAMQASYVLYMLVHRLRAALLSKRISICYPLLNHPEPGTEIQDAHRLVEELRNGAHSLILSMKRDTVFEGIASMVNDLDAAYTSLFE
ncbi:Zn(II)2Cys6 transcription factor, partial [Aspergillus homomorphus CBS 101889]